MYTYLRRPLRNFNFNFLFSYCPFDNRTPSASWNWRAWAVFSEASERRIPHPYPPPYPGSRDTSVGVQGTVWGKVRRMVREGIVPLGYRQRRQVCSGRRESLRWHGVHCVASKRISRFRWVSIECVMGFYWMRYGFCGGGGKGSAHSSVVLLPILLLTMA